jgi:hypothetical protein
MEGLDECFEGGEEEVVRASEAEGRVHGIVAGGLSHAGIGQVPHCICGRAEFGRVAGSDDWYVGDLAGFEEVGDGVCESYVVDCWDEGCRGAKCQILEGSV